MATLWRATAPPSAAPGFAAAAEQTAAGRAPTPPSSAASPTATIHTTASIPQHAGHFPTKPATTVTKSLVNEPPNAAVYVYDLSQGLAHAHRLLRAFPGFAAKMAETESRYAENAWQLDPDRFLQECHKARTQLRMQGQVPEHSVAYDEIPRPEQALRRQLGPVRCGIVPPRKVTGSRRSRVRNQKPVPLPPPQAQPRAAPQPSRFSEFLRAIMNLFKDLLLNASLAYQNLKFKAWSRGFMLGTRF
ncbi:hypothetical protein HDU96_005666 [Phlyctochytrium bullatum]|nr:hypothetical protein HDU96_005666 [Phlyctochytrium bullatum]